MHDRLLRHRLCGRWGWRLLHGGARRDDAGTHRGTRHRGHGAGGPAPYPGGQCYAGGRLLRRQTAYYPDIHDHDDLGRYYIEELDAMQVPEHLRNYIDYEAYGRDIALEESGQFTDLGYVRDTGDSFHEYYDGERGSIPEEYRVMTFQDDVPEEEISEWAMDLA